MVEDRFVSMRGRGHAARGISKETPIRRHRGAQGKDPPAARQEARLCHPEASRQRPPLRLPAGMERSDAFVGGAEGTGARSFDQAAGDANRGSPDRVQRLRGDHPGRGVRRRDGDDLGPRRVDPRERRRRCGAEEGGSEVPARGGEAPGLMGAGANPAAGRTAGLVAPDQAPRRDGEHAGYRGGRAALGGVQPVARGDRARRGGTWTAVEIRRSFSVRCSRIPRWSPPRRRGRRNPSGTPRRARECRDGRPHGGRPFQHLYSYCSVPRRPPRRWRRGPPRRRRSRGAGTSRRLPSGARQPRLERRHLPTQAHENVVIELLLGRWEEIAFFLVGMVPDHLP